MAKDFKILDVVIFGATGFTGAEICAALSRNQSGIRWAIAGRSVQRLAALSHLGAHATLIADVSDPDSLIRMAANVNSFINI